MQKGVNGSLRRVHRLWVSFDSQCSPQAVAQVWALDYESHWRKRLVAENPDGRHMTCAGVTVTQGQTGSGGTVRPSTRERGCDEWWRDWGLGGADVTLKEVLTHGPRLSC